MQVKLQSKKNERSVVLKFYTMLLDTESTRWLLQDYTSMQSTNAYFW